jgi:alpha-mannosidase
MTMRFTSSLRSFFCAALCGSLAFCFGHAAEAAPNQSKPIWSIGTLDGVSAEFAPGSRGDLAFTVGTSVVSKDFAGHHEGSMGFDGKMTEKPYRINFDLAETPSGTYELVMDLIYAGAAPARIKVGVNDRKGIFPVRLTPKHSSYGEEGNEMMLAGQSLSVLIDAEWLKSGNNQITIVPLGIGGMSYDAIRFGRTSRAHAELDIEPTIFFRNRGGKLMEVCEIIIPFQKEFAQGAATVAVGNQRFRVTFTNHYDFGVLTERIEIPAEAVKGTARIELTLDDVKQEVSRDLIPAKQWKVFICPKVHNDVGYTDLQPHVNELDNRNSDTVLDVLRDYPFYKFNFETSWLVENYLDCRTAPYRREFLDQAAKGRAAINALYLNLMTGLCTGEELYRAMYFTHRIHREHGGNFDTACLTDAPSHSWFLPTLFSDVGIKAFSNGANQTRAPILHYSDLNEDSPYYWEGMNGETILMWYSRSYVQLKRLTGPGWGGPTSSFDYLQRSVPQFLVRYMRDNYVPDAVMIYGAYVDNAAIPRTAEAPVIEKWNHEFEYPKLVVATDADYFNYIDQNFADRLPVYRGDCGAYWEDGVGSTIHATILNRQTQQVLPAAETAASLASIFDTRNRYPAEDFRAAWKNVMFYNEHTWGAHNSIAQPGRQFVERQWEIKESYATRANLDARTLLARGNNRLAQQIAVDGSSILAFNWQNRARTAPLEVEIGVHEQLVDLASNKPMPMDVYAEQDGWRKVRFVASDVPPLGYKAYAIRGIEPAAHKQNEQLETDTIENQFYRLVVDAETGGLKSLFDKTENRELLDTKAPFKMNEYVYVSGGEGSLILNFTFGTPPANLQLHKPENVRIVKARKTPLGQRIEVVAQSHNTPEVRTEYQLYDGIKRVDIINTVNKTEVRAKEAVYFAFPFAAQKPGIEYQIQNGWVRPNDDQMPGACREWFTPQNVVHVRDADFSIAWATPDAPLVTFTDINRGKWLSHLPLSNGHIYSYAMNNYWFTNYRAQQGGRFVFRFSITSGRDLNREQLADFDADTRAPIIPYPFLSSFSAAIAQADRPLPPGGGSFLGLEAPNLQLVTIKEAEEENGWILRWREVSGRAGEAELTTPTLKIKEAHLCNGVEEPLRKLPASENSVIVPFEPNQYITVRLRAESALKSDAAR